MPSVPKDKSESEPGKGVDADGRPVIDPTANVISLNEAATQRQDDLRIAAERWITARLEHVETIQVLRAIHNKDLIEAESKRVSGEMSLRAYYSERLEKAESGRIDAIRAVDVNAVAVASQRASDQASVLQTQVQQTAETLRLRVDTTATTVAGQLQQLQSLLSDRLSKLEQAGYQAQGRQAFSDPAFTEMLNEVKRLGLASQQNVGKSEGFGASWAIIVAVVGMALAGATFFGLSSRNGGTPALQPQVLYVPSPAVTPAPQPVLQR